MITKEEMLELEYKITNIPGYFGWWRQDDYNTFMNTAVKLMENGFTMDESIDLLKSVFWASVGEYGE